VADPQRLSNVLVVAVSDADRLSVTPFRQEREIAQIPFDSLCVRFGNKLLYVWFLYVKLPTLFLTECDCLLLRVELDMSSLHVIRPNQLDNTPESAPAYTRQVEGVTYDEAQPIKGFSHLPLPCKTSQSTLQ